MTANCPTCGLPMAWSETYERMWCSVYGDHWRIDLPAKTNVMRRRWTSTSDTQPRPRDPHPRPPFGPQLVPGTMTP